VGDRHDANDQLAVGQLAHRAIVPDAIARQALPVSRRRFTAIAWGNEGCDRLFEIIEDGGLPLPVQLGLSAPGRVAEPYA
jgi:hypothetical protein